MERENLNRYNSVKDIFNFLGETFSNELPHSFILPILNDYKINRAYCFDVYLKKKSLIFKLTELLGKSPAGKLFSFSEAGDGVYQFDTKLKQYKDGLVPFINLYVSHAFAVVFNWLSGIKKVYTIEFRYSDTRVGVLVFFTRKSDEIKNVDEVEALVAVASRRLYEIIYMNNSRVSQLDFKNFLSNINHELRTPLNAIVGFSNIVKDDSLPNEYRSEISQNLHDSANHLTKVIGNLSLLAELQSNNHHFKFEIIKAKDIVGLVNDSLNSVSKLYPGRKYAVCLPMESDNLKSLRIDRKLFKLALAEILENAFKYSSKKVELHICIDTHVEVRVKDYGIGMSNDELIEVQNFIRTYNSPEIVFKNYRIGIPIISYVMKSHHGTVLVSSEPEKGTEFAIQLPLIH